MKFYVCLFRFKSISYRLCPINHHSLAGAWNCIKKRAAKESIADLSSFRVDEVRFVKIWIAETEVRHTHNGDSYRERSCFIETEASKPATFHQDGSKLPIAELSEHARAFYKLKGK